MRAGPLLFLLFAALADPLQAASQATVAAVQAPAWLTRGERTLPLTPGIDVRNGDILKTGAGGRASIDLAEGSTVKLGEAAQLTFRAESAGSSRIFRGALDVAAGAFRFTTSLLRRAGGGRDIAVRVGTATIGIRGTDVWGRSNDKSDIVCLIEGKVEVAHASGNVVLDQPLAFFVAPRGEAAKPVGRVEPAQLETWARETDIEAGQGALRRGGKWFLRLGRFEQMTEALRTYDRVREAGYPARIRTRGEEGGWRYEVRLPGFPDREEAAAAARRLQAATGIEAMPAR